MGEDIWAYIEQKKEDRWICINEPCEYEVFTPLDFGRNRVVHNFLKNQYEFIKKEFDLKLKGLPRDLSPKIKEIYDKDFIKYGYGVNFLSLDFLKNLENQYVDIKMSVEDTELLLELNSSLLSNTELKDIKNSFNKKVKIKNPDNYFNFSNEAVIFKAPLTFLINQLFGEINSFVEEKIGEISKSDLNNFRLVYWFSS